MTMTRRRMARRLRTRIRGRTVTPPPNVGPAGIHCYLNRIAKTKSNKELVKGQRVSIVTYIDHVNISVTARQMRDGPPRWGQPRWSRCSAVCSGSKSNRGTGGTGGPGYWLNPEPNDRPHKRGALSTAKMPRESNSTRDFNDNGSQFFICVGDSSGLDRRYTVFGEVIRGMDVSDKIVAVPRDANDNPLEPIEMTITVKE